ncbi:3',5'-cyclic adenosine monophosphate phosphodiesterase CpdA [compost metagenome]
MERVAQGSDLLKPLVDIGNWRILMLNSAVPGSVPGVLDERQLALLEQSLKEAPERHHLICFHHQPVPIGCAWMAPIGLRNADALFALLNGYPQARALLWGHVHQEWDERRDGLRLLASPSTCIQFEPGSEDFKVGEQAPGYRWLRLHGDGSIDTGVSRVTDFVFTVDYEGDGY